jgi:hypothetical protein
MPRVTPDIESSQIPPGGQDAPESAIRAAQLSTVWFDRDLGWLESSTAVCSPRPSMSGRRCSNGSVPRDLHVNLDEFS